MLAMYQKMLRLRELLAEGSYLSAWKLALELATELTAEFDPDGRAPFSMAAGDPTLEDCARVVEECREAVVMPKAAGINPAWIPLILQAVQLLAEIIRKRREG